MENQTVAEYERRAPEAEHSGKPVVLRLARGIVWFAYAIVIVNTVLLILSFFLRLFGANPDAGFPQWIYRSSAAAMGPFDDMFRSHAVGSGNSVLDTSLLFAIVFYLIIAAGIDALLTWLGHKLDEQRRAAAAARQAADSVAYDFARQTYTAQQQAAQLAATQRAAQDQAAAQHAAQHAAAQQAAQHAAAQQAAAQQHAAQQAAAQQAAAQQHASAQQPVQPTFQPPQGTSGSADEVGGPWAQR